MESGCKPAEWFQFNANGKPVDLRSNLARLTQLFTRQVVVKPGPRENSQDERSDSAVGAQVQLVSGGETKTLALKPENLADAAVRGGPGPVQLPMVWEMLIPSGFRRGGSTENSRRNCAAPERCRDRTRLSVHLGAPRRGPRPPRLLQAAVPARIHTTGRELSDGCRQTHLQPAERKVSFASCPPHEPDKVAAKAVLQGAREPGPDSEGLYAHRMSLS